MLLENSGVEGIHNTFAAIDRPMKKLGFYPSWDYHKVSYDIKLEENGHAPEFYLRIPCTVVSGSVEHPGCEIELRTPITFKHYYPHGINYDIEPPPELKKKAENLVAQVKKTLSALPEPEKHEH